MDDIGAQEMANAKQAREAQQEQCEKTDAGILHICQPHSLTCVCGALTFTAKGVLQASLTEIGSGNPATNGHSFPARRSAAPE